MEEKTIFQKIIAREIPADILFEDESSIAFLDINPVSEGHTLLVSKEPYVWMQDVPDNLLGQLFTRVKKLMTAMKQGLGCDFVQISVVGKDVPHFHIHLIPRYMEDKLESWGTKKYTSDEEKLSYVNKIKEALLQ